MIQTSIKLSNLLMLLAAIGNNNYTILAPIIEPVKLALADVVNPTLDTLVPVSFTPDDLDMIWGALTVKAEGQYATCNANLRDALIAYAQTPGADPAVGTFLQSKGTAIGTAIRQIQKDGARFLPDLNLNTVFPHRILPPAPPSGPAPMAPQN